MILLLALLAVSGWTVAILALFLSIRFRADWSDIWKFAWLLRRQGWVVPGEVEDALTDKLAGQPQFQPRPAPAARPVNPAAIELSDPVMRLISESSEDWHQQEMADTARQMIAGGADENEVIHKLRLMMQEAGA